MKVYTKTGDKGQTSLANGHRVSKTDARIEAYGTSDELNSYVGLLRAAADSEDLRWIQNRLFDLGACLAGANMHLEESSVTRLENRIDAMQSELPELRAFVLPAGDEAACRCHVCRTVTRRLERCMLSCENSSEWHTELVFVNRLSDFFFVLSRYLVVKSGKTEEIWQKS